MNNLIKGGLNETPREKQAFSFGAIFSYPRIEELPSEYSVGEPLEIKNQNIPSSSFICVAEAVCSVSEYQEGVKLEPAFTVKTISELLGGTSWINEGTNLAIGGKAALIGFLSRQDSPHSVESKGVEYCAEPSNWSASLNDLAAIHKKQAFYWIGTSGKLLMFDAIRLAMWRFKNEKRAIQTGVIWNSEWSSQTYIQNEGTGAYGHSVAIIGWKDDYLKIQNSIGENIGEKGIQWIHKDLVNKLFKFGAIMFADMPALLTKEQVIRLSENYRKKNLIEQALELLNKLLNYMLKNKIKDTKIEPKKEEPIKDIIMDTVLDISKDIKDISNELLWDLKNARHSARVIMDEFNLSWKDKNLLCSVIQAESGFDINAINKKTKDYGICQINEYYWIGEGKYFKSIEEVLKNPEKSIRFICEQFLVGHLNYWVAYKSGSYLKFLK